MCPWSTSPSSCVITSYSIHYTKLYDDIAEDGLIFHGRHVVVGDDMEVAGRGDEDVRLGVGFVPVDVGPKQRRITSYNVCYTKLLRIAISKINSQLAENLSISGLLDFLFLFSIIFWGWLNGSLYLV